MRPTVALHIGAHKTATTHLQRSLFAHAADLRAGGVRFFGPPYFRNGPGISERFGLEGDVTRDAALATFNRMAGDAQRIVISEENFIGTMHNRFAKIALPLYPNAARRIDALAEVIAPEGCDVFLGVRNPARYISSGYCQALIGGHKVVLDEVKAKNPVSGIDWADLVQRVRAAKGVRSLTIWQYEDYHPLFSQITQQMLGGNFHVAPQNEIVHPGLSTEAVARILRRYAAGKCRQAAIRARDQYPVGPDYAPFDAFLPKEHAVAQAQYDAQLSQIAAMADVTLLKA